MKKQQGTWKIWAAVFVLFGMIVASIVQIDGHPVLNITGRGTKELIVIDAGHGGIQVRPKKYGLGMGDVMCKLMEDMRNEAAREAELKSARETAERLIKKVR